jgi:acyl-CoA synthetase (AMP-forming)/AMP-acid ligase II
MSRIRLKVPDAPPDKNRSRPVKSDNITLADFKYQAIQPIPTLFIWYVRCGAIGYQDAEGYFYILDRFGDSIEEEPLRRGASTPREFSPLRILWK